MDISTLMASVKGAIATVGKLREISKSMDQAELKLAIADLSNQLADTQLQLAELKDELATLRAENKALKGKESDVRPAVQWGCYKFEGDTNMYCPACYDTKGKKHLTTRLSSKARKCSVCGTVLGS